MTKTKPHRHPKRRSSDASNEDHDHDQELSDVTKLLPTRSIESKTKERPAVTSTPLARRSLEQYSVHIKGNATPIIIDNSMMTTRRTNLETTTEQQQQQAQAQALPAPKRVRFSALLRPPQRKPVPALQPQQALMGNPVTIHSELADRRGRPALQAIRTRTAAAAASEGELAKGSGVRVYQDRPA